jgi:hypothetical protein
MAIFVTGCGGPSVPGDPAGEDVTTSAESPDDPASPTAEPPPPPPPPEKPDGPEPGSKPGVPGSPIDYDSTILGAPGGVSPKGAKANVEAELDELDDKCKTNRCGIKIVINGSGACATSISPDPVYPGQTITIDTGPCPPFDGDGSPSSGDEVPPPTPEEPSPPSRR